MAKYNMTVRETNFYDVEVEAKNRKEAIEMLDNGLIDYSYGEPTAFQVEAVHIS
jgi:hypothetical protein